MIPPLTVYKSTPVFTEATVPAGLLRSHRTKAGTWGRIVVLSGRLTVRWLTDPPRETTLTGGQSGLTRPQEPHEVEPQGAVRFRVDFCREASDPEHGLTEG